MPSLLHISHMCSHLQNAARARLAITSVPHTKLTILLAAAMHRAGFFSALARGGPHPPSLEQMLSQPPEPVTTANVARLRLWLGLKYWQGRPVLATARPISTPKRWISADIHQLALLSRGFSAKLKGGIVPGLGLGECIFISTSRGLLEIREALERKVGGVLICRVS